MIKILQEYLANTTVEPRNWPVPIKKQDIEDVIQYIKELEQINVELSMKMEIYKRIASI